MTAARVHYSDFVSPLGGARRPAAAQDAGPDAVIASVRGRARAEGFAEGVAAAEARVDAEAAGRTEALIAAVRRMTDDRTALLGAAEHRLRSAASAFLGRIAPSLARAGLADEIAKILGECAETAPSGPTIEVGEAFADDLRALFAGRDCEVRPASDLAAGKARILWPDGHDLVDIDEAVARALTLIDAHLTPPSGAKSAPSIQETDA